MTKIGVRPRYKPKRHTGSGNLATPPTPLAARIRELRIQSGWTQTELAPKVGTLASRVSDWETGQTEPTLPLLKRIATAFGMTVSELLDGVM